MNMVAFDVKFSLPETATGDFSLVFPMRFTKYDDNTTPGEVDLFDSDFKLWRDSFDKTTDALWLSLPPEWHNALNWNPPP